MPTSDWANFGLKNQPGTNTAPNTLKVDLYTAKGADSDDAMARRKKALEAAGGAPSPSPSAKD